MNFCVEVCETFEIAYHEVWFEIFEGGEECGSIGAEFFRNCEEGIGDAFWDVEFVFVDGKRKTFDFFDDFGKAWF